MRITHFEIPSPRYYPPLLSIPLSLRERFKEVRETHFEIPSPRHFAPLSPKLLQ